MAGHPNTKKHKAQHGNYYEKPGKKEIEALCGMYAACLGGKQEPKTVRPEPGTQLSLF
jgi:hypothetical protein